MRHVKVIEGQEATLPQLKAEFGLQKTEDAHFFQEWEGELPALNDIEKKTLEDLRGDYLHLSTYPILEPIVTLVVLSPLLRMAGFYRSPFQLVEQQEIRIAAEDEDGKLSRGRVDILRFQPQFWTAAIESTTIQYSLGKESDVQLRLLNSAGVVVDIIENRTQDAGVHILEYAVGNLPPGMYLIQMVGKDFNIVEKLVKF